MKLGGQQHDIEMKFINFLLLSASQFSDFHFRHHFESSMLFFFITIFIVVVDNNKTWKYSRKWRFYCWFIEHNHQQPMSEREYSQKDKLPFHELMNDEFNEMEMEWIRWVEWVYGRGRCWTFVVKMSLVFEERIFRIFSSYLLLLCRWRQ